MTDIVHHHDHASVLLAGDLDWPRSRADGRLRRRRLAPWTGAESEHADPVPSRKLLDLDLPPQAPPEGEST